MTERVYLTDTYLLHGTAAVVEIQKLENVFKSSMYKIVLDRTIFHPQGGGQPSDIGFIVLAGAENTSSNTATTSPATACFPHMEVKFVQSVPGTSVVEHYGDIILPQPSTDSVSSSVEGDKTSSAAAVTPTTVDNNNTASIIEMFTNASVRCQVDEVTRMNNSRSHSGGHAIDAAVMRYGKLDLNNVPLPWIPTKGYHFSDGAYVEYSGKMEFKEPTDGTTKATFPSEATLIAALNKHLADICNEQLPTEVVTVNREDVPVYIEGSTADDFKGYPDRVRLVSIGGLYIACGGTHVRNTGELSGLTVTKVKAKKGVVKVSYTPPVFTPSSAA